MSLTFKIIEDKQCLKELEALATTIWKEHYIPIIGKAQVDYMLDKYQSVAAMEQQINTDQYRYEAIYDGDDLIGYFAVQPQNDTLFLSKLYLTSATRGKGYSRIALSRIQDIAAQHKAHAIKLTVNKYNSGAIAAYKALGFEVKEEAVFDIGQGYVMDDYVMMKQL